MGEIAELVIGKTPPRNDLRYWSTQDLTRPFCTIADMMSSHIVPSREGVTELAEAENKARRVPTGSLLMSFKLTLGRIGFAGVDLFPNEAIVWIRPRVRDALLEYLALWLSDLDLEQFSGRAVKGNTLNGQALRSIPIRLPSLAEQRRIVDLLSGVGDAIRSAAVSLAATHKLGTTILGQWASTWAGPSMRLGDIAELGSGPSWAAQSEAPRPGARRVLTIMNTPAGRELDAGR